MTQVMTNQFPEPGTRFAQDCFDSQVGKEVPFMIGGEQHGTCTLLGVGVADDGSFATMTFQVRDDVFEPRLLSVGFADEVPEDEES